MDIVKNYIFPNLLTKYTHNPQDYPQFYSLISSDSNIISTLSTKFVSIQRIFCGQVVINAV